MRKSIFDIASASINMGNEVGRIVTMSTKEKVLYHTNEYGLGDDYSLVEFIDKY